MAAIEVLEAHDWGTRYTETGGPTELLSIAGASFTNGDDYLVMVRGNLSGNNTNSNAFVLQAGFPDGTTVNIANRWEPSSTSRATVISECRLVTANGTDKAAINLQEVGPTTAYSSDLSIVAINLDDIGTASTDYWHNTNTTDTQNTTTFTARASVTLTPTAGDDLLVIGYARHAVDSTSVNYEIEVAKDGTRISDSVWHSIEGEDTNTEASFMVFGVDENVSATSTTYAIRTRDDTATAANNHLRSEIFVIPLDKFETHSLVKAADITTVTTSAWTQATTVTHTPTTTGNQIILAGHSTGGSSGIGATNRIQVAGTSDPGDPFYIDGPQMYDLSDRHSTPVFTVRSIDTSGAAIDLDYRTNNSGADIYEPIIIAFSAELEGGAVTNELVAAPAATATIAATLKLITKAVATVTGAATVTAQATQIHTPTATIAATGSVAAAATQLHTPTAAVTGTGSITATLALLRTLTAAITGTTAITAAATQLHTPTATVTGTASITATLELLRSLTATVTGQTAITAAATQIHVPTATVTGSASLSAAPIQIHALQASVAATASVTGNVTVTAAGITLLSGTVTATTSITATLKIVTDAVAAITGTATISAQVVQTHALQAAVAATASVTANLSNTAAAQTLLVASVTATSSLTATLDIITKLSGAVTGQSALTAAATQVHTPTGACAGQSAITASLTVEVIRRLVATVTATAALTSTATQTQVLAATVVAAASVTSSLSNTSAFSRGAVAVTEQTLASAAVTEQLVSAAATSETRPAVAVTATRPGLTTNETVGNITITEEL